MANNVFANGREIACKAADGKAIAAFPDVAFTPPQTPATPPGVPIPYPNTAFAKDTAKGSKQVKISGKEVMLKNQSYFKTSTGNEAGSAPKKGIITSKIKGKAYFNMWSMDVKFEGQNVVRHLDMTTHNHGSTPGNTAPWTYLDRMAMAEGIKECDAAKSQAETACGDLKQKAKCPSGDMVRKAENARKLAKDKYGVDSPVYKRFNTITTKRYEKFAKDIQDDPCQKALRCFLSPYAPSRCCPKQTPHHVVDAASFLDAPEFSGQARNERPKKTGWKKYDVDAAPCVCVEGPNQTTATHGEIHARTSVKAEALMNGKGQWSRQQATQAGVESINETFPDTVACKACLEKQLDKYHDSSKSTADDRPLDATTEGSEELKAQYREDSSADTSFI